jgi:glutamyl-tRNA synthetase
VNWRFRVPDDAKIAFEDVRFGPQSSIAGRDFGDFLVWRKDDVPSYQLACAVDDAAMKITEVVRGADLIKSTFRQILVHQALDQAIPQYYHCPLMNDDKGQRLAKRHDALSLRSLRERGVSPAAILTQFAQEYATIALEPRSLPQSR